MKLTTLTIKKILNPISISVIILLLLILVISYFSLKPFGNIEKIIKMEQGVDNNQTVVWDYLTKNGYKSVICKKDLFNPINVTITGGTDYDKNVFAFYTNFNRNYIFGEFKTSDYQGASGSTRFQTKDINKVVNFYEQKGCDFFKQDNSINEVKFSYHPPISSSEIQKNKEKAEAESKQQKLEDQFKKASPAEKIKILEADIADLQKQLLETNSQLDKEYLPKTIEDYQAQINQLKKDNGIQ